jgi:hypothetical protein
MSTNAEKPSTQGQKTSGMKMDRSIDRDHRLNHNNYNENRLATKDFQLANNKIWKMLNNPDHLIKDPNNPKRLIYVHHAPVELEKQVYN